MQDPNLRSKQQRLLAVRKQEALIARKSSKSFREVKSIDASLQSLVYYI
jgi:hypothetical protein